MSSPTPTDARASTRGPFAEGLAEVRAGRRTLLRAGGAGMLFSTALAAPFFAAAAAAAAKKGAGDQNSRKRAYVLVVDGCRPDEIDSGLTPTLLALRDGGYAFPRASSMPIMETIPNHVMMMTGLRPDRNGVPANEIYDREAGAVRTLDKASDLRADTVIEQLNRTGFRTGTVLSKEYLYGIFGTRATHRWEPMPIIPVSGHAPDLFTMNAALAMVENLDPHLLFVNLGDIDRLGHADLTGTSLRAARRSALASTDRQVSRFVELLKSSGRWANSIVIVLADHSMDWSTPEKIVTLTPVFEADPLLAGRVQIADNGGANLLYWTGDQADKAAAIARMRELTLQVPGVLAAHKRTQNWLRLGPEAGDVVAYCKSGWRFTDPTVFANPIPGNHGHPATQPIPFFIGGGHQAVPKGEASPAQARTVDVAPTIASFFELERPHDGWDGRARL